MVFYIANSIEEIQEKNWNLPKVIVDMYEVDTDKFMYCLRKEKLVDVEKFSIADIDPYADIIISIDKVTELVDVCKEALNPELISFYSDEFNYRAKYRVNLDEVVLNLKEIVELGENAIKQGKGLVSIGD